MTPETTSRGLCGLVCLSRTSARGEKGDCVKEGGGEEGERERERALGVRLRALGPAGPLACALTPFLAAKTKIPLNPVTMAVAFQQTRAAQHTHWQ